MSLQLRRGTNISHWLSQSARRGQERRRFFTRDDVRRIAAKSPRVEISSSIDLCRAVPNDLHKDAANRAD